MLAESIVQVPPVRIVVAAAKPAFRDLLRGHLEREPRVRVVGEAQNGRVASALIYRLIPDLLVIDCELNRELAVHRCSEGNNPAPMPGIVALITSGEPQQLVEALELGAKGVLLKTALPLEWGPGIDRVIAGQYWVADESIAILLRAARQFLLPDSIQLRDFGLTPRETEIARKIAAGRSNKQLGHDFSICERTVKHHLTNIFKKVGVSSRLELAVLVREAVTPRQAS